MPGATIPGMATKERVHQLVDSLPDTPETELRLDSIVQELEPNNNDDSGTTEPKKARRLSFTAIGASDASDVSERFDEYLGHAIDRRHPRA
jgi:hypothetical protein